MWKMLNMKKMQAIPEKKEKIDLEIIKNIFQYKLVSFYFVVLN